MFDRRLKRRSNYINTRAQIEMIGLVVVVILLAIGLLFYVKFTVFRDDVKSENLILEQAYITNLMGAIFNIKVCEESSIKIEEAIIACFDGTQVCDQEACNYVKNEIKEIISHIGINKYENYSISISKGNDNQTILNECKNGLLTSTTLVSPNKEHYTTKFVVC